MDFACRDSFYRRAAIIASQALLSGSFTIISEAMSLSFWPRLNVKYPSIEKGQLYVPAVNWSLLFGCLLTVAIFRSSSHMEAAYGLAITITMLMTTVLLTFYLRERKVLTRVRDKEHHKKLNRQLEKVADSFGNITDI